MKTKNNSTVVLAILDGFGLSDRVEGNGIKAANTPNLDRLFSEYSTTTLQPCGIAVGLPQGQVGNSEVGHMNMGAGRVVYQELTRITKEIDEGDFFNNEVLLSGVRGKRVHIMGLLSDGGVHSHLYHLKALVDMAVEEEAEEVFIHAFLDGRDTAPRSGEGFLWEMEDYIARYDQVKLVTVSGRYYAMDRDSRFERIELAYDAIVHGKGENYALSFERVEELYEEGITDEFVLPMVTAGYRGMKDGDHVIFANFRPDRARELTVALADPQFTAFEIGNRPHIQMTTMTCYDRSMDYLQVAYPPQCLENTLSEVIAKAGRSQLHIAETEKYAHVTFFFAGGVEAPYGGEDRILIPSPDVATYDLKPEMSAREVTAELISALDGKSYDFVVVNLANCDMVGHTGQMTATVSAVEVVDECVGAIRQKVEELGGVLMVTADHGNADMMLDESGEVCTAHSHGVVPFAVNLDKPLRTDGVLSDIAPTVLAVMGLDQPEEMTATSLFCEI